MDLDCRAFGQQWTYGQLYGLDSVPAAGTDRQKECELFAASLCNTIAGDGEASKTEILWIQGLLAAKGFPDDVVKAVPDMAKNSEGKSLEQVAEETREMMNVGTLKFAGTVISYHAIQACAADGLDPKEIEAIKVVAGVLNVDAATVDSLIELWKEEQLFLQKKVDVILPVGHPNLDKAFAREGMVHSGKE